MATMQGYMDGSYDYKQKYNIKDLPGPLPLPVVKKNTLMGAILSNPKCSDFAEILNKSQMAGKFNDIQSAFTVFVPLNPLETEHRDPFWYIMTHTLEHPLPHKYLDSAGAMYINTMNPRNRLLLENTPQGLCINKSAMIVAMQLVGNAVIYYVDRDIGCAPVI
jgi:hypothetical protein